MREGSDDENTLGSTVGGPAHVASSASARGMFSKRSSGTLRSGADRGRESETRPRRSRQYLDHNWSPVPGEEWDPRREESSKTGGQAEMEIVVGDMIMPVVGEA